MIESIPVALTSLKAATDIISSLLKLREFNNHAGEIAQLLNHIIQANTTIISVQQDHSSLTAKVQELEKECVRLKDWSAEKDQYERRNIGPGVFAYILKGYKDEFEKAHKFCCNCFDKTIKSTLQQSEDNKGRGRFNILTCPNGCPKIEFHYYLENK